MTPEDNNVILCCFPGTGKTFVSENSPALVIHDLDSSSYSWQSPGIRHPDWPSNYVEEIKRHKGIVLVSTHTEVIDALIVSGLNINLVYPAIHLKHDYLKRYKGRNSLTSFIELLKKSWNTFILGLQKYEGNQVNNVILDRKDSYLSGIDFTKLIYNKKK